MLEVLLSAVGVIGEVINNAVYLFSLLHHLFVLLLENVHQKQDEFDLILDFVEVLFIDLIIQKLEEFDDFDFEFMHLLSPLKKKNLFQAFNSFIGLTHLVSNVGRERVSAPIGG